MQITWQVLLFWSAVASSLICAALARDRNRSVAAWVLIGLVFNVIAVAILVRLPIIGGKNNNEKTN